MRCSGKIVIVTGGAMGIGLAIVQGLLAEGANVVIADRAGAAEAAKGLCCKVRLVGDLSA